MPTREYSSCARSEALEKCQGISPKAMIMMSRSDCRNTKPRTQNSQASSGIAR